MFNQTYEDWQIYLMNDEPRISLKHYQYADSRITVYENHQNMGPAFRWNEALEFCDTKYIAFLGADDIPLPWKLKSTIDFLIDTGKDLVYTDAIFNDGEYTYYKSQFFDSRLIMERNYIVHSTVVMKTDLAKKVMYPAVRYGEDWLFYNALITNGCKFCYLPIPTVIHNTTSSTIGVRQNPDDWMQKKHRLIEFIAKMRTQNKPINWRKS